VPGAIAGANQDSGLFVIGATFWSCSSGPPDSLGWKWKSNYWARCTTSERPVSCRVNDH
jgi:hypothetical protein